MFFYAIKAVSDDEHMYNICYGNLIMKFRDASRGKMNNIKEQYKGLQLRQ